MTREKWKLTKATDDAESQIDAWGGDENLDLGFSFMRALAEADDTLVEVEPGVWKRTDGGKVSTLDIMFAGYDEEDGVTKLGPGVYHVKTDGWL